MKNQKIIEKYIMDKSKKTSEVMKIVFSFFSLSFYYIFSISVIRHLVFMKDWFLLRLICMGFFIVPFIIISMVFIKTLRDLFQKRSGAIFKTKVIGITSFVFIIAFGLITDSYNKSLKKNDSNNIALYGYKEISEIIGETLKMGKNNGIWELKDLTEYLISLSGVDYIEITNRDGNLLIRRYKNIDKTANLYDKTLTDKKLIVINNVGIRLNNSNSTKKIVDLEFKIKFINDDETYYLNIGFRPVRQIKGSDFNDFNSNEMFGAIFYIFSLLVLYLFSIISVYFITKDFSHNLNLINGYMQKISKGNIDNIPFNEENIDITDCITSFNKMLTDLKYQKKNIIEKERKSVWDEASKRISHELRNPLTPIRLTAERLLLKYGKNDFESIMKKSVQTILTQVDIIEGKISDFSEFSTLPGINMLPGSISTVLKQSLDKIVHDNKENFLLYLENENVKILRDPYSLEFVFSNVIEICLKERSSEGKIAIYDSIINSEEKKELVINFICNGYTQNINETQNEYNENRFSNYKYIISVIKKIIEDHSGGFKISGDMTGCGIAIYFPILNEETDNVNYDTTEKIL